MSRFVFKVPPVPTLPLGVGFKINTTGFYDVNAVAPTAATTAPASSDTLMSGTGLLAYTPAQLAVTLAPLNHVQFETHSRSFWGDGGRLRPPQPRRGYGSQTGRGLVATINGSGSSTPSPTPTPTPSGSTIPADGTLSGLPITIVAGQQLSAVTYSAQQNTVSFMLYRVATSANEGLAWASTVMPSTLNLLIPQNAGAYTVRVYAYPGPVQNPSAALLYESGPFTVTAPPGALPATPTQTADTGATSTGVTMHWTSTATSYHVLANPGVGSGPYGSVADTTVSTNSYTFTGLPANSSPCAVKIPQNTYGSGLPALFISALGSG